jgi:hypothetical protein
MNHDALFMTRRPGPAEDLKLRQEIAKVGPKEMRDRIMQLTNPWIEAGKQEGLQEGLQTGLRQGRHQGEAELVLKQLGRRLGALSAVQEKSIRKLPLPKIEESSSVGGLFFCTPTYTDLR